tara:strand:- start:7 stop:204 length:198 start_codon:yes stop_codon:yes gene_type:complete
MTNNRKDNMKKLIEYQDAKDDYLLNLKEDDWDFYWNATDEEIEKDFLYHCSMYDDLKHIKESEEK